MSYQRLIIAFIATLLIHTSWAEDSNNGSLGVGFGIPYGGLGINYNHTVSEQVDLTAGIGAVFDLGWAVGARFYPQNDGSDSGPRLSAIYGTNAAIQVFKCEGFFASCEEEITNYHGLNLGLGWGSRGRSSGWDFDVLFIITSGVYDEIDKLEDEGYDYDEQSAGRVKLSVGYHW